MGYAAGDPEGQQFVAEFEQGLRTLGWTPGHPSWRTTLAGAR